MVTYDDGQQKWKAMGVSNQAVRLCSSKRTDLRQYHGLISYFVSAVVAVMTKGKG